LSKPPRLLLQRPPEAPARDTLTPLLAIQMGLRNNYDAAQTPLRPNMNRFLQGGATIAIAIGAGLVAFSKHLDPVSSALNPGTLMHSADANDHRMASVASGFGTAFITLGALLLILPWINWYISRQSAVDLRTPSSLT
jgi:hypothetical protein